MTDTDRFLSQASILLATARLGTSVLPSSSAASTLKKKNLKINFIAVGVSPACMSVYRVPMMPGEARELFRSLELEFQRWWAALGVLGTERGSLEEQPGC